jgi:exodeoxyribonuclease VII small subunit
MSEKTLETLFKELDEIVTKLEDENVSLEESFQTYNQGMELLKACNEKIDVIEKKMKVLDENGEEHEF